MRTALLSAPLSLALVLSACGAASNPEVDVAAEEAALLQLDRQFAAAVTANDIETAMTYYAADAVTMMPNEPATVGLDAIRRSFDEVLSAVSSMSWSPAQAMVARGGDMAITRGSYQMMIKTPAGDVEDRGKYLTVWKKVDGQWKVAFDAANTDLPLPDGH